MSGPLAGLRVFDLSRILAGPTCTQLLGDLGADVIKIERPGAGDDTRKWGPPYVKDRDGKDTAESAYYLSSNRNKRSLTIDVSQHEGQKLAKRLIAVPVPGQEKGMPAEQLAAMARDIGLPAMARDDLASARGAAGKLDLDPPPRILITGSLYLAGEVLKANGTLPQ